MAEIPAELRLASLARALRAQEIACNACAVLGRLIKA